MGHFIDLSMSLLILLRWYVYQKSKFLNNKIELHRWNVAWSIPNQRLLMSSSLYFAVQFKEYKQQRTTASYIGVNERPEDKQLPGLIDILRLLRDRVTKYLLCF